ncbi:MAG: 30S ribosomal protein S6 [Actinobacteria bacterium]|nr:30S ribosomal protein S6 [Actinomycetota bacterium]
MRPYEIVVIFDADLEEETIRAAVDRATEHITKGGGEVSRVDHWGKRRFAYELRHRWEGYYVVLQARAEPGTVEELDRSLSLADEVLRQRVVRVPEQALRKPAEAEAAAEIAEA